MNKVVSWVKENKVAAAAVAGLAFLFMAKKGGGGGGGEALPEGDDEGGPGTYAVGVPIGPDYDTSEAALIDRDDYKEGIDIGLDLAREAYEREDELEDEETATDEPPPSDAQPVPMPDKQGITIKGKFFRHATGYTISRVDNQGWTEYLVKFDGKAERWQEKRGQWLKGWENPTRDRNRDKPKADDGPKRAQDKANEERRRKGDRRTKATAVDNDRRKSNRRKKAQQTKQHKDAGPTSGTKVQGKTNTVRKKAVRPVVKSR